MALGQAVDTSLAAATAAERFLYMVFLYMARK
jgi:hypothetical protein